MCSKRQSASGQLKHPPLTIYPNDSSFNNDNCFDSNQSTNQQCNMMYNNRRPRRPGGRRCPYCPFY